MTAPYQIVLVLWYQVKENAATVLLVVVVVVVIRCRRHFPIETKWNGETFT